MSSRRSAAVLLGAALVRALLSACDNVQIYPASLAASALALAMLLKVLALTRVPTHVRADSLPAARRPSARPPCAGPRCARATVLRRYQAAADGIFTQHGGARARVRRFEWWARKAMTGAS